MQRLAVITALAMAIACKDAPNHGVVPPTDTAADSSADAPMSDAANTDAANTDAVSTDAVSTDAVSTDAAAPDAATPDAAMTDAANPDAAVVDAANPDAAVVDAAPPDATVVDAAQCPGECTPNAVECEGCGVLCAGEPRYRSRVCDQNCTWGAFSACSCITCL